MLPENSPEIENICLYNEEAKKILDKIKKETYVYTVVKL